MSNDPFGVCLEPKCNDDDLTDTKELPSFRKQVTGFIKTAWDVVYGFITGKGLRVSRLTYQDRLKICNGCEFFIKDTQRCSECGCFMKTKAKFKQAYCPLSKWEAIK